MMLAVQGSKRQRTRNRMAAAARDYAALGWACVPGAQVGSDRACSCDRMGCPDPGAHPVSTGWARLAGTDPEVIARWWAEQPAAGIILPTGRVFDVFDVPAEAGVVALTRLGASEAGPVAAVGAERYLFFVMVVLSPRLLTGEGRRVPGDALALPRQLRRRPAVGASVRP